MTPFSTLTDDQRVAGKSWAIAVGLVWIVSFISYAAAVLCYATGTQTNYKIWILGTLIATRIGSEICLRRMQRIIGETTNGWLGLNLAISSILIGLMVLLLVMP